VLVRWCGCYGLGPHVCHLRKMAAMTHERCSLNQTERKLLTASERKSALEMLSGPRVTIDEDSGHAAFHKTSTLAEKYGLSVYDAAYLEVALRRQLPLGSRDRALRSAANRSGVKVL
jgi:predicted nucleic acid-binding protein